MAVATTYTTRGRGRKRQARSPTLQSSGCSGRAGVIARRESAATAAPLRTRSATTPSCSLLSPEPRPSPPSPSLTSVVGSPADVASIPRSVSRLTDGRGFGAGYWTSPASKRRCARSPRLARASSIATDTPIPITPQPPSQLASPLAPTPPASPTALDSRLPTLPHACSPAAAL